MNMKRGLVFTLCTLAVASLASTAAAQNVQLSLNLRYTDPADPSEGGKWFLVAKTDDAEGIAGISAYISNIAGGPTAMVYGNGTGVGASAYAATTAATIAAILNGGNPYNTTIGTAINVVYGQDTAAGPIVLDVGQGAGTPGNTAVDPLRNPAWNNAAVIATGTFAGGGNAGNQFNRPAFVTAGTNVTDSNTHSENDTTPPNNAAQDAATTVVVRGDSVISFGLNANPAAGIRIGDVDRNGLVNINDFGGLSANFGPTPGKGWDQGDFNDDGLVNINDFGGLSANFGMAAPPAPVAAIPEPSTALLLGIALLGLGHCVKRS
jgi:hypothetical protein